VMEDIKNRLDFCAKLLKKVAKEVFRARSWVPWTPRLTMFVGLFVLSILPMLFVLLGL
jgi:hypothetical protein